MFDSDITYYGVKRHTEIKDEIDQKIEELLLFGYTAVDSGFSAEKLQDFRDRIDAVYEKQVEEFGDLEKMKAIGENNIARALLAYDDSFLEVATNTKITSICERIFGGYYILLVQNAIINQPYEAHGQGQYHRDLPYQHFVSSEPIAINVMLCVDDFTEETGGTVLVPCSHKTEVFPSEELVRKSEIIASASAGTYLVFDSMVYHRAGANISDHTRRGINHMYAQGFLHQQISFPKLLGGRYKDDPFLSMLLGYRSEPADSVMGWRQRRLARLEES